MNINIVNNYIKYLENDKPFLVARKNNTYYKKLLAPKRRDTLKFGLAKGLLQKRIHLLKNLMKNTN